MSDIDKVCKQIAEDLGEDFDLVKQIVQHQFLFTIDVMKDPNDYHDIMFNKLFRFSLKPRFKADKQSDYSPNNKRYESNRKENNNPKKGKEEV